MYAGRLIVGIGTGSMTVIVPMVRINTLQQISKVPPSPANVSSSI